MPLRPVWLLAPPEPLPERAAQPLLAGRALQLLSGPERIVGGVMWLLTWGYLLLAGRGRNAA